MKQCIICKKNKERDQYFKKPMNKDGLAGKCKGCYRIRIDREPKFNADSTYQSIKNKHKDQFEAYYKELVEIRI